MRTLDLPDQSWSIDDSADSPDLRVGGDDTANRSFHYGG
jgi:hypothetical protein